MSTFWSRASSDSRIQLAATAVLSGGVVAAGLLSYQRLSHEKRVSRLKDSIPNPTDDRPPQKVCFFFCVWLRHVPLVRHENADITNSVFFLLRLDS